MIRPLVIYLSLVVWVFVSSVGGSADEPPQRIVFLAGGPSHGYGAHEHQAGCRILAETIQRSTDGAVVCEVIGGGWPEDDSVLDGAAAIVMYCDGGGGHPALRHLPRLGQLIEQGVGFSCLHYAVEVPVDRGGPEFLQWLGGYFETHWSVNPHWEADFTSFPDHPVTRGVQPFKALDEWYFHMRFQPEMAGVTPVLSAVPPQDTMRRPDGPHSGNPTVRQAVAAEQPQHVAWVYERPDGGRSFGFTGGHFHWNWGREEILRLVCNAIVWTAGVDVPADGLPVLRPSVERLEQGQDQDPPENHQRERIQREFRLLSRPGDATGSAAPPKIPARRLAATDLITTAIEGHAQRLEVDVTGVKKLFLVVNDGGNGYACDWADWIEPVLRGPDLPDLDLTTLDWTVAHTDWGQVHRGRNAAGGPLRVAGQEYQRGIGTHANSVIGFDLPAGYQQLEVLCGLDNGGTDQGDGRQSSVQFLVYADAAPSGGSGDGSAARDPSNAVASLALHPELEATLSASEPAILSLTNLDIDHRGRVWVCEVVNYRSHNGKRPEGDRILILEDETGDGVMDTYKVFYQGRDIDSAMGICVLGNQVIVSASPYIWLFTDETGNDVPDRKELLFSKTGIPQHDHSAHSFIFGPDGKLYWNFGNTGHAVHDAQGNPITDMAGNRVNDSGQPYRQGMVFRCNLDGSQFEVLGHNFRNNYEVTVDSFGTLWQSDNDDDGHRGVRINYVMEFGNFGYTDELTGAGWQAPRANIEATIPQRHWHLNDPGVVPTLLLTGAGSPSGIAFYEGDLLPEVFRNQMIHCDPGPNVVRAYPTEASGAGYTATMVNLMEGVEDKWFRPVDVCTAPDGSLFVTDWYDPGVGGHHMGDLHRGRLFRLAPPGHPYRVPTFDFASPAGAVQALTNPNLSVRYLAWQAIQSFGQQAVQPLQALAGSDNPRLRARAFWALGKLPGYGSDTVAAAMADPDSDVRCMAIRLARQLELPVTEYFDSLIQDPSAAVRRDLAIALHLDESAAMPGCWARLAAQHDDRDRWYLEALGIGAQRRWDDCFKAYEDLMGQSSQTVSLDIAWRARTPLALPWIIAAMSDPNSDQPQVARMLRALDYHAADDRRSALEKVVENLIAHSNWTATQQFALVESLVRIPRPERYLRQAKIAAAVEKRLESLDRPGRVNLLRVLPLPSSMEHLVAIAEQTDTAGIAAAALILERYRPQDWLPRLFQEDTQAATGLARSLAGVEPRVAHPHLTRLLADEALPAGVRVAAAKGLTQSDFGAGHLIELAAAGSLLSEARLIVGSLLRNSPNEQIRQQASQLFPAPKSKAAEPLPPLAELVQRSGDPVAGEKIYRTTGTCANCHQVQGQGKNVGPDLSQIGSKLAKEAMYVTILDPSAGISHSYESYAALTQQGQLVVGLMISQTEQEIVLKNAEGIEVTLRRAELDEFKRLETSLMPDNLAEALTTDELVDLVEYLMTLRGEAP